MKKLPECLDAGRNVKVANYTGPNEVAGPAKATEDEGVASNRRGQY